MAEIKGILSRYDIAGIVSLHTPGHSEFLNHLQPSYSCAKFAPGGLRFRAKLQEDFNGDKEKMMQVLGDTSNMLYCLSMVTGQAAVNLLEASEQFDKLVGPDHEPGKFTSSQQQNN